MALTGAFLDLAIRNSGHFFVACSVAALAVCGFWFLFFYLGAFFRLMGTGTFDEAWREATVTTRVPELLAVLALRWVVRFILFDLDVYVKEGPLVV